MNSKGMERAHGNGWCAGKGGRGRGVVPIAYLSSVRPMYPSRTFESRSCTTGKPPNDVSARIASTSSNFNPTLGNKTKSRIITALTGTPNECSSLLSRNGNPLNQIILPSATIPTPPINTSSNPNKQNPQYKHKGCIPISNPPLPKPIPHHLRHPHHNHSW